MKTSKRPPEGADGHCAGATDSRRYSFKKVKTGRLLLGVKFFDPSGFGFSIRGTFVKQSGEFVRVNTGSHESDSTCSADFPFSALS